ncbi:MAG: thioredoxin family protein [Bacteroidales bacterium]|nr:thioredoxin family protein [Bacteroidales bacterium]
MKNSILSILLFLIFTGCSTVKIKQGTTVDAAQPSDAEVYFSKQETWLLGYFNPDRLTQEPYSSWYVKGFEVYQTDTVAINKLMEINKDSLSLKVVMGTWCPDSRREVPRFMKIMDIWKFPVSKITFIGVDNEKLSPMGEYSKLDIQRVPTFIIFRNNIEAGRIIENPTTSLEQDLVNILYSVNNNK